MRRAVIVILLGAVLAACSDGMSPIDGELDPITVDQFQALVEASPRPLVVNLWASWCIPCRSEAPLLRQAHAAFGEDVTFLGVATEDTQSDALGFIDEFELRFENRFDRSGSIRGHLGASGLPVTVFVHPGGEIMRTHFGVIDDRALALGIDDLLAEG